MVKTGDPVIPREDHISLSTESTLQVSTKDKEVLLKFLLNELVDELHQRVNSYGYQFKMVAVKIVRSDFSVETREMSYAIYQTREGSITLVIQALLDRFLFDGMHQRLERWD